MLINRGMDEEDLVYIHEYHLAIKKIKFCHLQQHGWIMRMLCLVVSSKQRQILCGITYMWNLKNNANKCFRFKDEGKKPVVTKGKREEVKGKIKRYKQLCINQISNRDILYSTGNYSYYPVITFTGV